MKYEPVAFHYRSIVNLDTDTFQLLCQAQQMQHQRKNQNRNGLDVIALV
jgi:hypothetical protein